MVSLNNPFDLWLAINLMRDTPYEKFLAKELKAQLLFKVDMPESEREVFQIMKDRYSLNFESLQNVATWNQWDEQYT